MRGHFIQYIFMENEGKFSKFYITSYLEDWSVIKIILKFEQLDLLPILLCWNL